MSADPTTVNVLILEDSTFDTLLLQAILEGEASWRSTAVERLEAALNALATSHFDAVLADLNVPDSNGLETLRRLRAVDPWLPILVLTGDSDEALGVRAMHEGAQEYLIKGETPPRVLLRTVRHCVERCRLERRLGEAQRRQELVIEQSPLGMIELGVHGNITAWNPSATRILGFSREEALSLRWESLFPALAEPSQSGVFRRIVEQGDVNQITCETRTRDGANIICEWFNTPIRAADGAIVGVSSLCRDITAARLAEQELYKIRQALQQAPLEVLIADTEGRVEVVNDHWEETSGLKRAEASFFEATPPEVTAEVLRNGGSWNGETARQTPDGDVRWEWSVVAPVRDSTGRVVNFARFTKDITDRKILEVQLHRSEEALRSIFDSMHDGFIRTKFRDKSILCNPAARRLFACPEGKPFNPPSLRALYADDGEYEKIKVALIAHGELIDGRARMRRFDGVERTFEGNVRLVWGTDGRPAAVEVLFRDITERLVAEEERQKREADDAASRLKDQFLAHMSHEIRNPLNAILGMAHLALKRDCDSWLRDYLESIQGAGQSLLRIVNDILDFSKVEAGKLAIEQVELQIDEMLEQVLSIVGPRAAEKNLDLEVNVADEVPRRMRGDSMRLSQILLNLLGNAIKFTDSGRVVLNITLDSNPADAEADDLRVRFCVLDTGLGMTPDQMDHLFTAFFQADSSITRKYGGTGLGLAICRQLVELMGGIIWVDSELGEGSSFNFTAVLKRSTARDLSVPDLSGVTTLVVDPHDGSRSHMVDSLARLGIKADAVDSADSALALERAFDITLVEEELGPGYDVGELARSLRRQGAQHLVLLVARGRPADVADYDAVLPGPYTGSSLLDTIVTVLGLQGRRNRVPRRGAAAVGAELPASMRGMRVLVAEDNPANQRIARELLESAGLVVDIASDGKQAVDMLLAAPLPCPYKAVLLDLQMPVMDGFSAAAAIRAHEAYASVPLMAMSAHVLQEIRERCKALGMNDFVTKPVEPEQLFATLSRWIRVDAAPTARGVPDSDRLAGIPGLDSTGGLRRVAGNQQLYQTLLLDFAREHELTANALQSACERGDGPALRHLAHTLKGVAANLGVLEVQIQAAELESLVYQGREARTRPAIALLLRSLSRVSRAILSALEGPPPTVAERVEMDVELGNVWSALERLEVLLMQCDGSAANAVTRLQELLGEGSDWSASLKQLQSSCRLYEFEDALQEVRRIKSSFGAPAR